MIALQRAATILLTLALAAAVGAGAWWLATQQSAPAKADKPPPPALVPKVAKEDDLNTVTLTEEAAKRLGVRSEKVALKSARRVRLYGGEVVPIPGKTVVVSAPVSGTLKAAPGTPQAGQLVTAGQKIFQLLPLLTPEGRASMSASLVEADGQVNNARTQIEAADVALKRAKSLLREQAGSRRTVEEAQAVFDLATKALEAATARRETFSKIVGDAEGGTAAPLPIDAPEAGVLRTVSALPGQTVPSGAALFEVVDLSSVWVRVPVSVGDFDALDRAAPAQVGAMAGNSSAARTEARPAQAPPSANPLAATVDLFYALPNAEGKLVPGQRLGVSVSLAGSAEMPVVAKSALVFDIHGNSWVYEEVGARKFARRRVAVPYTQGSDAVLAGGPAAGALVVVEGAQELFGSETGFVK